MSGNEKYAAVCAEVRRQAVAYVDAVEAVDSSRRAGAEEEVARLEEASYTALAVLNASSVTAVLVLWGEKALEDTFGMAKEALGEHLERSGS